MSPKITTFHLKIAKGALAAIMILALAAWLILGFLKTAPLLSAAVKEIALDKTEAEANGEDAILATLALRGLRLGSGEKFWVGLKISPATLISPEFSQGDFYSEDGQTAAQAVDAEGRVLFQLKSQKAGTITYRPYLVKTTAQGQSYWKPLNKSFQARFR